MKSSNQSVAGGVAANPPGGAAGLGRSGLGTSGGQRLPASPRERKPALAALAVLLILGGALASAYLVMASGQRVSAIRIAQPVAAGQRIPPSALEEVQVGDTGIQYINWSERQNVGRYYAAVPLVKGALLTNSMISPSDGAAKGRLVVGLALKPGQLPARGVDIGKRVTLYAVGGGTGGGPRAGTVLSPDAIVIGIARGGGDRLRSDQTTVDVAVLPADAPQLTQAASAGTVALALVPDGTKVSSSRPAAPESPERTPGAGEQSPPATNGTGTGGAGTGTPGTGTPGTGTGTGGN